MKEKRLVKPEFNSKACCKAASIAVKYTLIASFLVATDLMISKQIETTPLSCTIKATLDELNGIDRAYQLEFEKEFCNFTVQ